MEVFPDVVISYGYLDNLYLVFKRATTLFNRRRDKILSDAVSLFVCSFVFKWKDFFDVEMEISPNFKGKITLFPRLGTVKDF